MSVEKQFTIACPECHTEYRVSAGIAGRKVTCKRCKEIFTATHKGSSRDRPSRIGKLAVKYNLITKQQLMEVLAAVDSGEQNGKKNTLGTVLVEKGFLTDTQVEMLKRTDLFWKANRMSRQLGALAVAKGMITDDDLAGALEKQAALFKETQAVHWVKDILFEDGLITRKDQEMLIVAMENSTSKSDGKPAAVPEAATVSTDEAKRHYDLVISEDAMDAALHPKTEQAPFIAIAAVHALLREENITHGIVDDQAIESFFSAEKAPDASFTVARGTPPEPGVNAAIRYHFPTGQKIGTLGTAGSIDFKDKGEVPFVNEGDLLLEKIAASPGKSGADIHGQALEAASPGDIKILTGSGVLLSEDKFKAYAKTDGQPKLSLGGRLSVVSDLVINGDVDLKTGHIDFEGDVKVTGAIQSGFKVKAANVSAKEIMGAEITATGSVTATGGIIGGTVKAQGEVTAKFIKNATLSTFGDIIVQKEITDSNIDTSGACRLARGKILSSEIAAKQGIEALDIGTDLSTPCKLTVGVDDHIEAEIEGIQGAIDRRGERLDNVTREMEAIETEQQEIHKKIAEMAQIQDRSMVEKRPIEETLATLSADEEEKRRELERKITELDNKALEAEEMLGNLFDKQDELTQQSEELQDQVGQIQDDVLELKHELEAIRQWAKSQKKAAIVKADGSVSQGTVIAGPHTRAIIKDTCRHVAIREVKNTDPDSAVDYEIKIQSK